MTDIDNELFVLQLFGLEEANVESVHYARDGNDGIVHITLAKQPIPCPHCGHETPKIKNYVHKKITHSILSDRRCTIDYNARRYQCPICGRTYYEFNPFVFKSMKISIKTVYSVLEDLKDFNETYASVAQRYHISPTSVISMFDKHVSIPRKTLPKLINFDEVYAFRSKDSKYVCVLLDYESQEPIDILPKRHKDWLISYFMKIPLEERKKVKMCCSDMYPVYRDVVKSCFPTAIHTCDHFHVVQDHTRRMDTVRKRIMRGYPKNSDEYYLLKHFNWILFKCQDDKKDLFDPAREREYNKHFQAYLNFYEIRELLLSIDQDLNEAWKLKDDLSDFYGQATVETAPDMLEELIKKFRSSSIKEMREFAQTLNTWQKEIVNSFYIVAHEYKIDAESGEVSIRGLKMNNAIIENRNAIIKCLKKNANGFTNWERFRNRTLYVLNKESSFMMMPTYPSNKIDKSSRKKGKK